MGFLIRAFAMLKGAVDWFSFANDTVGLLGLAKRAAAGAAIVGAAASVTAAVHHIATGSYQAQPAAVAAAQLGLQVPDVKIDQDKLYSRLYLEQPEHKALLDSILAKCKDTNEIPPSQCDIAVAAKKSVAAAEREVAFRAALRRATQQ